jgi:hypothetical protein
MRRAEAYKAVCLQDAQALRGAALNARVNIHPPELEDRLIEWSRYFKDRHKYSRCASLEGNFNPHAPGAWDAGWGDPGAPTAPLPPIVVPRAVQTNDAILALGSDSLGKVYKWSITYHYCFPGLDRWRILKAIRKYSGRQSELEGIRGVFRHRPD